MEPPTSPVVPEGTKVLAAGSPRGRRVEIVERPDGSIAIMVDGIEYAVYPGGMRSVEWCIKSYLGVHRSCENGEKI